MKRRGRMKTLGDLKKFASEVEIHIVLFGSAGGTAEEARRRFRDVGEAVCRENKVRLAEAGSLPLDTPLGELSGELAEDLERWFKKKTSSDEG
jgi:hypothetical protein